MAPLALFVGNDPHHTLQRKSLRSGTSPVTQSFFERPTNNPS